MADVDQAVHSAPQQATDIDYLIVGGGPAGLQLAYYLERTGRDYVVLEAAQVADFFTRLPRHRRLISNNKVHTGFTDRDKNLRWDWNSLLSEDLDHLFSQYSHEYLPKADDLVRYLRDFRHRFALRVEEGTRVTGVSWRGPGRGFTVRAEDGRVWRPRRLIMATGHTVPYIPEIPGVELCEEYSRISTDPADYVNQRVLILGKGNSAMETAENLMHVTASTHVLSPSPVRVAWNTHHVSDVRGCYHNTMDSYQLKMQNTILDGVPLRIDKGDDGRLHVSFRYTHARGQTIDLTVDRIILCCGFRFDYSVFDETCRPETCHDGRWPKVDSTWEAVGIPDLYFIGALMQARDYKESFSGFIHGFRYNLRFLNRLFAERYHDTPLVPDVRMPASPEQLSDHIVQRAVNASSLFQLPAFMTDLHVFRPGDEEVSVYHDIPRDYALDAPAWRDCHKLTMDLEYGKLPPGADPFAVERDPLDGTTSQFVHPVCRLYRGSELVDTYHVPEDLENEWDKPMYTGPLRDALASMIEQATRQDGLPPSG
ncbi:NAD(P)-binding domain-containing protein [Streptomyces sp. NPDC003522]